MVINAINTGSTIIVEIDPFSKESIEVPRIRVMKSKNLTDSTWDDAYIQTVSVPLNFKTATKMRLGLSKAITWAKFLDEHMHPGTELAVEFTQDKHGEPELVQQGVGIPV